MGYTLVLQVYICSCCELEGESENNALSRRNIVSKARRMERGGAKII